MPSASKLGTGRFPSELLEVIDRCLRLRETERIQGSRELLEALRPVGDQRPQAESAETARPLLKRTGAKREERGARAVPPVPVPHSGWRRAGWLALAGLVVGLGLVLATWWSFGFVETVRDEAPAGASDGVDREIAEPERGEAVDSVPRPNQRDANREPPLEASGPAQREAGEAWVNSLGMEFVWVPAGNFVMGSPIDEEGRETGENQHEVQISAGYWMKKYEVTQGEWVAVMGANPSHFSDCGPRCPVEDVSWDDTQDFIRRLNNREPGRGYAYRLPTEAEWEYAARAGTAGARHGELSAIAWHGANSGDRTHPVGQKRANAWGLHDMLGNVSEWTGDRWGEYPSGAVTDPKGPESGSYPESGWYRVVRGSNYMRYYLPVGYGRVQYADYLRSARRNLGGPIDSGSSLGFRLARTE